MVVYIQHKSRNERTSFYDRCNYANIAALSEEKKNVMRHNTFESQKAQTASEIHFTRTFEYIQEIKAKCFRAVRKWKEEEEENDYGVKNEGKSLSTWCECYKIIRISGPLLTIDVSIIGYNRKTKKKRNGKRWLIPRRRMTNFCCVSSFYIRNVTLRCYL